MGKVISGIAESMHGVNPTWKKIVVEVENDETTG